MLIRAFLIALSQLTTKSLRRVIWLGLCSSAILFVLLVFVISLWLFETNFFTFDGFLSWLNPIIEFLLDLFGVAFVVFISCLLFPSVVHLIVNFFADDVALAVETELYPHLPEPRKQGRGEIVLGTFKFIIISLALNVLAIPFYVLVFPISPFVFFALNGYLLGREYFELAALRRVSPAMVKNLRRAFRGQLLLAGILIAFMMTIPIVNFITPVIAVAVMVNLVEFWRNELSLA